MDSTASLRSSERRRGSAPLWKSGLGAIGSDSVPVLGRSRNVSSTQRLSEPIPKASEPRPVDDAVVNVPQQSNDEIEYARRVMQRKLSVSAPMFGQSRAQPKQRAKHIPTSTQPRVLLLASEKDTRSVFSMINRDEIDYQLLHTKSILDATSKFFSDSSIRALLCWESLPEIDSTHFIQEISESIQMSNMDVFVILPANKQSAQIDFAKRDELISLGCTDVIIAPFHPNLLKTHIERTLSIRKSTNQLYSLSEEPSSEETQNMMDVITTNQATIEDLRQKVKTLCFRIVLLDKEKQLKDDKKNLLSAKLQEKEAELENLRKSVNVEADGDVESIKKKIEHVFETPVQGLLKLLEKISSGEYSPEILQSELISSIRALGSSDLYAPRFEQLLFDSHLDGMTKSWIKKEFNTAEDGDETNDTEETHSTKNEDDEQTAHEGHTETEENEETKEDESPGSDDMKTLVDGAKRKNSNEVVGKSPLKHENAKVESQDSLSRPISELPKVSPNLLSFATPGQFNQDIRRDSLDVLLLDESELIDLAAKIFSELNLFDKFQIPKDVFVRFMQEIRKGYHTNPYHNFHHAVDVLHSCYLILTSTNITEYLTWVDIFALAFAALCHDIDHPGVNNNFLILSQSQVALIYNDQAVLENHHCFQAFSILQKPNRNIAAFLSPAEYKEFRKASIFAILSTDMARHFEYLSKFATRLQTKPFSRDSLDDRMFVMGMILHTADLGNVMRPPEVSRDWSNRVMAEFLLQGDTEKEFGFPISPFMNRHETNPAVMSLNFLDFIAIPLVESMVSFMPDLLYTYNNIKANRAFWFEFSRTESLNLPIQYEDFDDMSIGLFSGSFWKENVPKLLQREHGHKETKPKDKSRMSKSALQRPSYSKVQKASSETAKTKFPLKIDSGQKNAHSIQKAKPNLDVNHSPQVSKKEYNKPNTHKSSTLSATPRTSMTASLSSQNNDTRSPNRSLPNPTRPNSAPVSTSTIKPRATVPLATQSSSNRPQSSNSNAPKEASATSQKKTAWKW